AQRGKRVGGLARLRNEHGEVTGAYRRLAVAELRSNIDFDRQPRETLEPVFGDEPGVERRPTGRDRDTLERAKVERQLARQLNPFVRELDVVRERVADDLGLLVDFLRHEVAMVALVDEERGSGRL